MQKQRKAIKINKIKTITLAVLLLFLTVISIYSLYSISLLKGIENIIRLIIAVVIIIVWLASLIYSFRNIFRRKKPITYSIVIIIYMILLFFSSSIIDNVITKLKSISEVSDYTTYSSSIVVLKDTTDSLNSITKIGMVSDNTNVEGNTIPNEIISKKKLKADIVDYQNYGDMLKDLYDGNIDYIFLPTSYVSIFNTVEEYKNIDDETKIIYSQEKQIKKDNIAVGNKKIDEPFSILLMGVDSENENIKNSTVNGDSLIILTFNPKTLKTTILSIPRDTYVPIACFPGNRKNKITHAAWQGEGCMINTIQNFLDIKIDYYVKINFKGVVKLVDAVGGVKVDVPYSFCEQNSDRKFGSKMIYVRKGVQTLNGEEALALARNRKSHSDKCSSEWTQGLRNDFVRNQNQQLVVKALMNKLKDIRSIDKLYEILDTLSISMETNMPTDKILSFYNVGKDILSRSKDEELTDLLNMQKLRIKGYDYTIYDYTNIYNQGMRLNLYNFVPYKGSVNDVIDAMKVNLGLKQAEVIKTFSFNVDDPYEETVIGYGSYNESKLPKLPNFVGSTETYVKNYCSNYGIEVHVEYVTSTNINNKIGTVTYQDLPSNMDIDNISKTKGITIKVVNKVEAPNTTPDCRLETNKNNSYCQLPNFVGRNISEFNSWKTKYSSLNIIFIEAPITDGSGEPGTITKQSADAGTSLYDLLASSVTITYIKDEESIDILP